MLVLNSMPIICSYNSTNNNYLWHSVYYCYHVYDNEVLHNTCDMCTYDLPDVYSLMPTLQLLNTWFTLFVATVHGAHG